MSDPVTTALCNERMSHIDDRLTSMADLTAQTVTQFATTGAQITQAIDALNGKFDEMTHRLYHDNGGQSMQSAVNQQAQTIEEHNREIRAIQTKVDRFGWWLFSGVVGAAGVVVLSHFLGG